MSVELLMRSLVKLECAWGRLDDLKYRVGGQRQGVGSSRLGPRAPLDVGVLSIDGEITVEAQEVFSNVAVDLGVCLPSGGVPVW